jgi:hypothetical protein
MRGAAEFFSVCLGWLPLPELTPTTTSPAAPSAATLRPTPVPNTAPPTSPDPPGAENPASDVGSGTTIPLSADRWARKRRAIVAHSSHERR